MAQSDGEMYGQNSVILWAEWLINDLNVGKYTMHAPALGDIFMKTEVVKKGVNRNDIFYDFTTISLWFF